MTSIPLVAITAGDVAGIGPEIVMRAAGDAGLSHQCIPLAIGHPEIFIRAARLFGNSATIESITEIPASRELLADRCMDALQHGRIPCWNASGDSVLSAVPGRVSAAAGEAAYRYLIEGIALTRAGLCDALTTAPLNKESLHLAGHHFPGHTEILAAECGVSRFAMMLYLAESSIEPVRALIRGSSGAPPTVNADRSKTTRLDAQDATRHGLSIAHVTLHNSVACVPGMLSTEAVQEKTLLMANFLAAIGCRRSAIGVCALNPHGGENGLFGDEEQRVIAPAVSLSQQSGLNVSGPLPVDTLIRRAVLGEFDGVVAMYHDQGHIPVKLIGFDSAVNITLGLPIVRTSPTHGTAFDRAWNPATPADAAGMMEAVRMAAQLAQAR